MCFLVINVIMLRISNLLGFPPYAYLLVSGNKNCKSVKPKCFLGKREQKNLGIEESSTIVALNFSLNNSSFSFSLNNSSFSFFFE